MTVWVRFPDWWWATHAPVDSWFVGQASWVDQIDLPQYFRVIRMGMEQGNFHIVNFADSRSTDRVVLYPLYTLIGILMRPFTHDPVIAFHVSGSIMGILFMLSAYWFLGLFLKSASRMIGWYWLFLTGGIGWTEYPGRVFPDIGVPIFNVWSALRSPHEAATMIALMGFLGCSFQFFVVKKLQRNWLLGVGLAAEIILLNHPQTIVPLGLICGVFGLLTVRRITHPRWWQWCLTVVAAFGGYYSTVGKTMLTSPVTEGLRMQTTYVFSPWYWLAGWGGIGLLMIFGWRNYTKYRFLWIWLVTQLALFYLPFVPYRGMMIRGVWIAVVVLAVQEAAILAKKYRWKIWMVGVGVLILSLGDFLFIFSKRMDIGHVGKNAFISQADGQMLTHLFHQGKDREGVIGSYRMANLAVGSTRLSPYAGHYPLTPHFAQRYPEVVAFYQRKMTDNEALTWLKNGKIEWIMMGKEEQQLARASTLSYPFLKAVWNQQGILVYRRNF